MTSDPKRQSEFPEEPAVKMGRPPHDLTGRRFGMLLVLGRAGMAARESMWIAACDCGSTCTSAASHLIRGKRSCGCALRRIKGEAHGRSRTAEHRIWLGIRARCINPSASGYHRYGGRGIRICDRWSSFLLFLGDMGPRPSPKHSVDRIDNEGHYEPANCRWATHREQCRNTSRSKPIEAFGAVRILEEWSELTGVNAGTIRARLRRGWSPENAVSGRAAI